MNIGDVVIVKSVTPFVPIALDGNVGFITRWLHDEWYMVNVNDREYVLDASRGEITKS